VACDEGRGRFAGKVDVFREIYWGARGSYRITGNCPSEKSSHRQTSLLQAHSRALWILSAERGVPPHLLSARVAVRVSSPNQKSPAFRTEPPRAKPIPFESLAQPRTSTYLSPGSLHVTPEPPSPRLRHIRPLPTDSPTPGARQLDLPLRTPSPPILAGRLFDFFTPEPLGHNTSQNSSHLVATRDEDIYKQICSISRISSTDSLTIETTQTYPIYEKAYHDHISSPLWFSNEFAPTSSSEELVLFDDVPYSPSLPVPSGPIHQALARKLFKQAAVMGYKHCQTEFAGKEINHLKEEDEFEFGYRRGITSVISLCMNLYSRTLTNVPSVGDGESLDETMMNVLQSMATSRKSSKHEEFPDQYWTPPPPPVLFGSV
jgi:hypothetical protein